MKNTLLLLAVATTLTGCAGVKVAKTDIATGATDPKAIYIRTYADEAQFRGRHGHDGETAIRHSLAPAEFSKALKQELEKMAPARVLAEGETPTTGWLVESNLEVVDAGTPFWRAVNGPLGLGFGSSKLRVHVRVIDAETRRRGADDKDSSKGAAGNVLYEFDLAGGSRGQGGSGSTYAPGLGYATPFDYKNAAERVYMTLSVDRGRTGGRTTASVR
jgi:hypothetical protein